ncbi:hypothetical protein [Hylemonella gracilis]|uniref:hypothetical protein n=1 Tax=Hylemonella gracilis TaxID=80880 RepID=UPI0012DD72A0|nr:hypothetical protein [Hylemonella gracilis]
MSLFPRAVREALRVGVVGLTVLLCVAWAQAQPTTSPVPYDAEHDARERARIEQERARAEAQYKQARADCYQRFRVNSCLTDARRARRVVIDRLRAEEIVLDDAKRLAEAQAQKQRVEARQAERARQEAAREQEDAERARSRTQPRGNVPAPANR